ncbi:MAG: universal stress protein [Jatrophihabitantaceae bacterium]
MTNDRSPVVLGVDASTSDQLLNWALDEARARKVPLRLLHAFGGMMIYGSMSMYSDLGVPDLALVRATGEELVAATADRAAALAPDVELEVHAIDGDAVSVLLEEAKRASTIIVGARHLGVLGATVLGSVSNAVSARAACPVVVVLGPSGLPAESPAVVVGVDAGEDCEIPIAYAFEYASRHDLPIHAVLCWHPDLLATMSWRGEPAAPARAEAWLSEALAGWREKYPSVPVHSAVVREHPVAGLVEASAAQHLLVVGTRGRHAFVGTLLGSVSQGVLHHGVCPVAVVPSPTAARG